MPVKRFTIFDTNFEIGRLTKKTFRSSAMLSNFNPASMTSATLYAEVKLTEADWGLLGLDEFVVGIWHNKSSGDPDLELELRKDELYKVGSADISPSPGNNYFQLKIGHGRVTELGYAKGHITVYLDVQYADPKSPPSGNEPVTWFDKVANWIRNNPIKAVLIGLGGLLLYSEYRRGGGE